MAHSAVVRNLAHASDARNRLLRAVSANERTGPPFRFDPASYDLVTRHVRARRGEVVVYRDALASGLHAIRFGTCKSVLAAPNGLPLVAGYHIVGDVLGVQTMFGRAHDATIVALEDSEICVVSADAVRGLAARSLAFRNDMLRMMDAEIARQRETTVVLGVMRAEQRLAWFLLDLACRYRDRGYSAREFTLRMTREDIGSCLGLTQETISRLFGRFHREGLVQVQGRQVMMIDAGALQDLVEDAVPGAVPK